MPLLTLQPLFKVPFSFFGKIRQMKNSISVIIPTKNGGDLFRESLEMIFSQEIDSQLEVIIIDSGSTDHTLRICAEYPVKLIQIPASSFSHSASRNLAISEACGDICVLTVQDAIPVDRKWLATLVEPLIKNEMVAGAYGQQVSRDDASWLNRCCKRLFYQEWRSNWKQEHEQLPIKPADWQKLSVEQKRVLSRFDNVNSCIRRSVWQKVPFPEVPYAEDIAWAIIVLTSGFSICWQPLAQVFHSHDRSLAYEFKRSYVDSKTLAVLFGGSSSLMTPQMVQLLIEWLAKEAARYLQLTPGQLREKEQKIEFIAEADRIWQLELRGRKRSSGDTARQHSSGLLFGAATFKDFLLRQYYRGVLGPEWFRKMCRCLFRDGRLLRRRFNVDSSVDPSLNLKLQGCHRYFLNQLLQIHLDNKFKTVDSNSSIRFGSAVLVAGSFLGQYLKTDDRSGSVKKMNDSNGQGQSANKAEFWQALDDWYKQDYGQEGVAISRLDQLLTDGV